MAPTKGGIAVERMVFAAADAATKLEIARLTEARNAALDGCNKATEELYRIGTVVGRKESESVLAAVKRAVGAKDEPAAVKTVSPHDVFDKVDVETVRSVVTAVNTVLLARGAAATNRGRLVVEYTTHDMLHRIAVRSAVIIAYGEDWIVRDHPDDGEFVFEPRVEDGRGR